MIDQLNILFIQEQNLLKSSADKLITSSNEIVHDNILSIFDNTDEISRKLYNYLKENNYIKINNINKNKKEEKYEEFDCLLLKINE